MPIHHEEHPSARLARQQTVEAQLIHRLTENSTGVLEVVSGQIRRAFFLREGALVGNSSNLKSETPERLATRISAVSPEDLLEQVAIHRLSAAIRSDDPVVNWHEGRTPSKDQPLDAPRVLWKAFEMAMDDGALKIRFLHLSSRNPAFDPTQRDALDRLHLSEDLRGWIELLDGLRPIEEVVEFGPAAPITCGCAVWLGWLVGAIHTPDRDGLITRHLEGSAAEISLEGLIRPNAAPPRRQLEVEVEESTEEVELPDPEPEYAPELMPIVEAAQRIEAAQNYFEMLGVGWEAGVDAWRDAYFSLARLLHPDQLKVDDEALRQRAVNAFDRLREGWETLKDETTRAEYIDRIVHGKKTEDELAMEKVREILDGESIFRRGMAAFNAGQIVKAHATFEEVAKLVPEEPEYRVYLGYTTYRTQIGRDEEAAMDGVRMLRKALEDGARVDTGQVLMGRIYRERGDEQRAVRAFLKALKANPANTEAQKELERLKRLRDSRSSEQEKKEGFFSRFFSKKKEPERPAREKEKDKEDA